MFIMTGICVLVNLSLKPTRLLLAQNRARRVDVGASDVRVSDAADPVKSDVVPH
jgi:hypothetical protein